MTGAEPAGRSAAVAAFERVLDPGGTRWVMLIDGLSGTGKSHLLEWIRLHACDRVPTVAFSVAAGFDLDDVLRRTADQLGRDVAKPFRKHLDEIRAAELKQVLVQHAPVQSMEASRQGELAHAAQSANLHIDMDSLAPILRNDRHQRRLDAFLDAVERVDGDCLAVLIDDGEALVDNPELAVLVLDQFVTRLRDRFPQFRLCIAGQTVPRDRFRPDERSAITLGALDLEGTRAMLSGFGIDDPARAGRIFQATSGHPLLIAMEAEHQDDGDSSELADDAAFADRTRWIYERVVGRMKDQGARVMAPDLVLLDWFDLGILRAVFGDFATEPGFRELVARSFTKRLADGRYSCHDVVRLHLPAQRWESDPERCRGICRSAFAAYVQRLSAEETKAGAFDFNGRQVHVSAALRSALRVDHAEALRFGARELATAIARSADHAFRATRVFAGLADGPFADLARDGRRVLGALALHSFDRTSTDLLVHFATICHDAGRLDDAGALLLVASTVMSNRGCWSDAAALSRGALDRYRDPRQVPPLARALAGGGDFDAARKVLADARAAFGAAARIALAEADLASSEGDVAEATRLLRQLVETSPEVRAEARLRLARLLHDRDPEAAMAEVEAVLRDQPNDADALATKLEFVSSAGQVPEVVDLVAHHLRLGMHTEFGAAGQMLFLDDRAIRLRVLAEFEERPESLAFGAVLALAQAFSLRGECDEVDRLAELGSRRWPLAAELLTISRARARTSLGRHADGLALVEPVLAAGTGIPAAYEVGFLALAALSRWAEARNLMDQLGARVPAWAGYATAMSLGATAHVDGPDAALARVEGLPPEITRLAVVKGTTGTLLLAAGREPEALAVLEDLVHTNEIDDLTLTDVVGTRGAYASLLVKTGRKDDARQIVRDLVVRFPHDDGAVVTAAAIFVACDDDASLRELAETVEDEPVLATKVLELHAGLLLQRQPDVDRILAELAQNPDRVEIAAAAVIGALRQNRPDAALMFERVAAIAPEAARRWERLMVVCQAQETPARIAALFAATKMNPGDPIAVLALANSLAKAGRLDEAVTVLESARAAHPEYAERFDSARLSVLIRLGRLDEVQRELAPYLGGPLPPLTWESPLVEYLKARGEIDELVRVLCRIADSRPDGRAALLVRAADELVAHDRPAEALDLLRDLDGPDLDTRTRIEISRIDALGKLDRHDEALGLAHACVQRGDLSPTWRSRVLRRQGRELRRLGRVREAVEAYAEACECNELAANTRYELSEILEEIGEFEAAYDVVMEAFALDPTLKVAHPDRVGRLRSALGKSDGNHTGSSSSKI